MKTFILSNNNGMNAEVTNYGGRIMRLMVPDRDGKMQDVVLGFDTAEDYLRERNLSDFGAAIGRYANRIGQGRFTLEGRTYQLPQNNGPHCLHGGPTGWQYSLFEVVDNCSNAISFELTSPDGDNGFPGTVKVRMTYRLTEDNTLAIDYEATTDAPTVINMTNHSYFNLNGDGKSSILNHILQIDADRFLPIDPTSLPTGAIAEVADSPFDFRKPKAIGIDIARDDQQLHNGSGYDHNWLLNRPGDDSLPCARLASPLTGIVMEVFTTEPGMQVYTGNFLDGSQRGKGGAAYPRRSAVCLETQKYPDSSNHNWPESDARLRPGERFTSRTRFKFSTL